MYSAPDLTDQQEQRIRDLERDGIYAKEMNAELFHEAVMEMSDDSSNIDAILSDAPADRWSQLYEAYCRPGKDRDREWRIGDVISSEIRAYATRDPLEYDSLTFELALIADFERLGFRIIRRVHEYVDQITEARYPHGLRHQPTEADRAEVAAEWKAEERRGEV